MTKSIDENRLTNLILESVSKNSLHLQDRFHENISKQLNILRNKVSYIISAEYDQKEITKWNNLSNRINALKQIEENNYKPLLQQLTYSENVEDIVTLTNILYDLGQLNIHLGDLTSEVKYYTDAAIFNNFVITILNENETLKKSPAIVDDLKQKINPYSQLNNIQNKLLTAVGAQVKKFDPIINQQDIDAISHKQVLIDLRANIELQIIEIENMRIEQPDEYINLSRTTFEEITLVMQDYLAQLYKEAEIILGQAPCTYAIIGLGSMALKQITPYSDLEFAIIIEEYDSQTYDYFYRLTHLVHFKVINLGESTFPTSKYGIDISHLGHQAVNFDLGGKTPLGRMDKDKPYELIGTINWLMKYVSNAGDIASHIDKNLPYILEKVCFVHGNESLVKEYQIRVSEFLKQDYITTEEKYSGLKNHQVRALKILEEGAVEIHYLQKQTLEANFNQTAYVGDLQKLTPVFGDENEGKLFDVKQEIYRLPDRMIYNLGMYFGVNGDSAWGIIDKLLQEKFIYEEGAQNLKNAVSFATTLRLATYSYNKCQNDSMTTYELAIEHLSEQDKRKFTQETFYIQDTKILHNFYYTMLSVIEIAKGLCNSGTRNKAKKLLKQDKLFTDTNYNKAMIHGRFLEYGNALIYMEAAKNEQSQNMKLLNELFYLYYKTANIEKAIIIAKEILEINRFKHPDAYSSIAASYNNIGNAYNTKGEYEEAIKYYKLSLKVKNKVYKNNLNHSDIAGCYNNLGNVYSNKGEYEEAVKYYRQTLKIILEIYDNNSDYIIIAGIFHNLGAICSDKGEYEEAVEYFKQSLKIKLKVYYNNPNHPSIAASYNNLGGAYREKGEYDTAIKYYKQSLEISLKTYKYSPNHPDIAASYNNLGIIYNDKGEYKESIKYHKQSLLMRLRVYESIPNNIDIATSYNNLGSIYTSKGKYEKAIKYYKQSLKMKFKAYEQSSNHPNIASGYNNLGNAYSDRGEYDIAIKYYKKSLEIRLKTYKYSSNHPDIAASYYNLGEAYKDKGEYNEATEYYKRSLKIRLKAYEHNLNHPVIAECYNGFGTIHHAKEDYNKAIKYYKQSLVIQLKAYEHSPNHLDIAMSYNNLGAAYSNKGEYEEAIKYYSLSLKMKIKIYGYSFSHPSIAKSYNNLGAIYTEKGECKEAIKCFKQSLIIMQKAYEQSPNHPDIVASYNNLKTAINFYTKTINLKITSLSSEGTKAYKEQNYDEAIVKYNLALELTDKILEYNPSIINTKISINYNIARSYHNDSNLHEALKYYNETYQLNDKHVKAKDYFYEIAKILYHQSYVQFETKNIVDNTISENLSSSFEGQIHLSGTHNEES